MKKISFGFYWQKLKYFLARGVRPLKRGFPLFLSDASTLLLFALVLIGVPALLQSLSVTSAQNALYLGTNVPFSNTSMQAMGASSLSGFISLAESFFTSPVLYALMAFVLYGRIENTPRTIQQSVASLSGRWGSVLLTNLAIVLVLFFLTRLVSMAFLLLTMVTALVAWIPVVGWIINALTSLVGLLLSTVLEVLQLVALTYAMLGLIGDGYRGRHLWDRALGLFWGGRTDSLPAVGGLCALWMIVLTATTIASTALISLGMGTEWANMISALVHVLLVPYSASVMAGVYFAERDRVDGIRVWQDRN